MLSLNLDDLCDESNEEGLKSTERVMRHWTHTRSPLVYWTQKMVNMATTERYGQIKWNNTNWQIRSYGRIGYVA